MASSRVVFFQRYRGTSPIIPTRLLFSAFPYRGCTRHRSASYQHATGVPRSNENTSSYDPTVGLYQGSFGGLRGGRCFLRVRFSRPSNSAGSSVLPTTVQWPTPVLPDCFWSIYLSLSIYVSIFLSFYLSVVALLAN